MAQKRREQGDRSAIDQWRPQELERVGKGREAEETDRAQRHVHLPQPGRERVEDQQVGQSRREPERQHDQHAPLEEDGERCPARCARRRLAAGRRAARSRTAPVPPSVRKRPASDDAPCAGCGIRLRRDPARSLHWVHASLGASTRAQKNRSCTSMMSPGSTLLSGAASISGPLDPPRLITMSS